MLAKMPRPSRTAATMVAKLSSARIIFAASLVTSVPVMPIAIADVGRLQRRRVVDAVAGHRHDVAVGLQRVDDAQLVRRRDARIDRVLAHRLASAASSSWSSSAPVSARRRRGSAMPRSAAMRAAVRGWSPVIIMTRMPARRASAMAVGGLGARRVDDADHADEDQVVAPATRRAPAVLVTARAADRRRRGCARPLRRAARRRREPVRCASRRAARRHRADAHVRAARRAARRALPW